MMEDNKEVKDRGLSNILYKSITVEVIDIAIIVAAVVFVVLAISLHSDLKPIKLPNDTSLKVLTEVQEFYNKYYIGDEYDENKAMESAINGYVQGIGDKYGTYLAPLENKQFNNKLDGVYTGVGITISTHKENDKENLIIEDVAEGSPASQAGIKTGGKIVKVGEKDISTLTSEESVSMLRGVAGDKIDITIEYDGVASEYSMVLEQIKVNSVEYKTLDNDIGYLKINSFGNSTNEEFNRALKYMKDNNISKFVFDLRNNSGGLVDAVIPMVDSIVPEGLIARVVSKNNEDREFKSDSNELNGDMVVITNGNTASAAELFALNMREYDKATIIGEKTYGKGTELSVVNLSNGGSIVISSGKYYTKSIPNIEGVGITTDIEIEKIEGVDNQLDKAIELLNNK